MLDRGTRASQGQGLIVDEPFSHAQRCRKFDVRQWVLVTGAPLAAWFYAACYLRFCAEPWSLVDLGAFAHLSNNCVAREAPGFGACAALGEVGCGWDCNPISRWQHHKESTPV